MPTLAAVNTNRKRSTVLRVVIVFVFVFQCLFFEEAEKTKSNCSAVTKTVTTVLKLNPLMKPLTTILL